jgi:hypothetical protein
VIRVALLKGPVDVSLADRYPGVSVTLERLTGQDLAEARAQADGVIASLRDSHAALGAYGLDQPDADGRLLNPRDLNQMGRVGRLLFSVEASVRAVKAWTGITVSAEDAAALNLDRARLAPAGATPRGEPLFVAPIDRRVLAVLLLDDAFERRLLHEIELAARVLVTEGNVSAVSPNGLTAPGGTASDLTTAATAPSAGSPAPRAD